jgi:hypothetical protein
VLAAAVAALYAVTRLELHSQKLDVPDDSSRFEPAQADSSDCLPNCVQEHCGVEEVVRVSTAEHRNRLHGNEDDIA